LGGRGKFRKERRIRVRSMRVQERTLRGEEVVKKVTPRKGRTCEKNKYCRKNPQAQSRKQTSVGGIEKKEELKKSPGIN